MREFKFRAWINGKMINNAHLFPEFIEWNGSKELMQFTGLKDKSGKEIYEGDFIAQLHTYDPHHIDFKTVVYFDKGAFMVDASKYSWWRKPDSAEAKHNTVRTLQFWNMDFIEIIGNIYEKPDLLDRTK